jgi:hypothetical protein
MTRERTHSSGPLPFRAAAGRVLVVGVGFIALVALLFGGVGAWQGRDQVPDAAPEPAPEAPPAPAPAPTPAPPPAPPEPAPDDDDDEAEETPPPAEPGVRPNSEVSVQVLDGISGGDQAAVARIVATLREAGFRIVAQNAGRPYDVTTVFYNDGYEAEARRVAQAIGAEVVNAMSSLPPERRLSASVNVHVIVGADSR